MVDSAAGDRTFPLMLRIAGILVILGGVGFAWNSVELVFIMGLSVNLYILIDFATSVLIVVGGFLAFRGKAQVAPFLIVTGLVLNLSAFFLIGVVDFWTASWFQTIATSNANGDWGFISTILSTLRSFAFLLVVVALLIPTVTFIVTRQPKKRSPRTANPMAGIAIPNADGSIPEGWYADPDGKPAERFWDGSDWTEKSRPRTSATAATVVAGAAKPTVTATGELISPQSRAAAAVLCFFLGVIGVHRFYVGKIGTGVAQIVTLGGLGIWVLIDLITILVGSFRDIEERVLINW